MWSHSCPKLCRSPSLLLPFIRVEESQSPRDIKIEEKTWMSKRPLCRLSTNLPILSATCTPTFKGTWGLQVLCSGFWQSKLAWVLLAFPSAEMGFSSFQSLTQLPPTQLFSILPSVACYPALLRLQFSVLVPFFILYHSFTGILIRSNIIHMYLVCQEYLPPFLKTGFRY